MLKGIKTNSSKVFKDIANFTKKVGKADMASMNRAARDARVEAKRSIREEYNIKAKDLNQHIRLRIAKGSKTRWATISARAKRLGVEYFNPRQLKKRGTKVTIRKGKRLLIKGAFIPGTINGVYRREGYARLPIKRLHTISIAGRLVAKKTKARIFRRYEQQYNKYYKNYLKHLSS